MLQSRYQTRQLYLSKHVNYCTFTLYNMVLEAVCVLISSLCCIRRTSAIHIYLMMLESVMEVTRICGTVSDTSSYKEKKMKRGSSHSGAGPQH